MKISNFPPWLKNLFENDKCILQLFKEPFSLDNLVVTSCELEQICELKKGDRVVHIGGFPRTGEDPLYTIEVWERNLDGTFEIFESNQKLNGWFQPLCFFVGEDDYPIV